MFYFINLMSPFPLPLNQITNPELNNFIEPSHLRWKSRRLHAWNKKNRSQHKLHFLDQRARSENANLKTRLRHLYTKKKSEMSRTKIEVERRLSFPVLWLSAKIFAIVAACSRLLIFPSCFRAIFNWNTTLNNRLKTVNVFPKKRWEIPLIHNSFFSSSVAVFSVFCAWRHQS